MQPSITSTSGSRSNTPVRGDPPEQSYTNSQEDSDTCTSARATPIAQHMKLKRKLCENRQSSRNVENNTTINEAKVLKSSTVSNPEISAHAASFPNIRRSPVDPLISTETKERIKEESPPEIIPGTSPFYYCRHL